MNVEWKNFPLFNLLAQPICVLPNPQKSNESIEDVILNYDICRTRIDELSESDQFNLKLVLKQFCKHKKHPYKQGMNEILAPFIILVNQGLSLDQAYHFFTSFVEKVIPSVFTESVITKQVSDSLSGLFKVINLLTKYVVPEVFIFFESQGVTSEFFMTSWVVTVFASKIQNFAKVFYLWESILRSGHRFFICLVCVALLDVHKESILQQPLGSVLVYLSSISLDSEEVLNKLIRRAYEILNALPRSVITWLDAFDMLDLSELSEKSKALEKFQFLEILPDEFLRGIYPEAFWSQENPNSFVLIDLRAEDDFRNGFFPNSAFFDKRFLDDTEKVENFVKNFEGIKGFSHFVIMQMTQKGQKNNDALVLANAFINKGFGFVCLAFGGFLEAHRFTVSKGLMLRKHQADDCRACIGMKKSPKKFADFFWPNRRRVKSYECLDQNPDFLQFKSWVN